IIGVSVNQINVLVDRTIASGIAVGGISALSYANKVTHFVIGLFVIPLATVMYPMISKMAVQDNKAGLKDVISEVINLVNLFVMPVTIGAIIFAEPIVVFLFGRGAFDEQAAVMTAGALSFYAIGMIGYGIREVLSRGFYALQDTKTPMINATISVMINIILNVILSKYMGLKGLALATSVSAIICTMLLFISFRRKLGPFGMKHIVISGVKIVAASGIMGIIAKVSYAYLCIQLNGNLALLAAIMIGAMAYFTMIFFARIREVDNMVRAVRVRLRSLLKRIGIGD
ncbi:MAG: murein biosynthesis integral membrane protein MurJ, partial [Thermacetogeniaceae bacterium]